MCSTAVISIKSHKFNYGFILLICTFVFGFLFGAAAIADKSDLYSGCLRSAVKQPVSSFSVLSQVIIPFVFTALIYGSGKKVLFFPLCFFQAFLLGICANAIYMAYGNAHWLVFALLLFTSAISITSLLWFWLRHISVQRITAHRDFLICLSVSLVAAGFDRYALSLFIMHLLN